MDFELNDISKKIRCKKGDEIVFIRQCMEIAHIQLQYKNVIQRQMRQTQNVCVRKYTLNLCFHRKMYVKSSIQMSYTQIFQQFNLSDMFYCYL